MDINTLAVIGGIVVIGFLIFRLIFKTGLKILGTTFIFGILVIGFLVGTGKMDLNNFHVSTSDFKLMDLDNMYCGTKGADKVICDCIVKPLDEKLKARYTAEELNDLKKNKARWIKEIYLILKEHKGDFQKRLHDAGADGKWNEFINQIVGTGVNLNVEKAIDDLKNNSTK